MSLEYAKSQVDMAFTRSDPRGLAFENAFGGATSFLRRRYTKDLTGVDLAVTGVPFDQAVTNRPGTRLGPRAIREASSLQTYDAPYGWGFDPLGEFAIADYGDLAFDYARVAEFPGALVRHIRGILEAGAGSLVLGGDHYISLPILRAYAETFGPVSLLQFDAHGDTWADDDMARIDHGTMVYKAVREGLVNPATSVQVGIRTDNPDPMGFHIIDAPEVHETGPQAAAILRGLKGTRILGGDVVEVSPPFDATGATAIAGAHAAMEILSLWCSSRRK